MSEANPPPASAMLILSAQHITAIHKKTTSAVVSKTVDSPHSKSFRRTQSEIPGKDALKVLTGDTAAAARLNPRAPVQLEDVFWSNAEENSPSTPETQEQKQQQQQQQKKGAVAPNIDLFMSLPEVFSARETGGNVFEDVSLDTPTENCAPLEFGEPATPTVSADSPSAPTMVALFDGPVSLDSTIKSLLTVYLFPLIVLIALFHLLRGKKKGNQ